MELFFCVFRDTSAECLDSLLCNAWDHHPLTTLRIISYLRHGRHEPESFIRAAIWLHHHHPKSLANNIRWLHLQDFPEILYRLVDSSGPGEPATQVEGYARSHFHRNPVYSFLHTKVTETFVSILNQNSHILDSGFDNLSRAVCWCPTPNTEDIRSKLLCETIATSLHVEHHDIFAITPPQLLNEAQEHLSDTLTLQRNAIGNLEVEDEEDVVELIRFHEYAPYFIIYGFPDREPQKTTWDGMLNNLSYRTKFPRSLAVCPIMCEPHDNISLEMQVGVSMTILISELSHVPWKGKAVSLCRKEWWTGHKPEIFEIEGADLVEKAKLIQKKSVTCRLNFSLLFETILTMAMKSQLKADEMVEKIFIFANTDFYASLMENGSWETTYDMASDLFQNTIYKLPKIVFWNMAGSNPGPEPKGVALVSGSFSDDLLDFFIEGPEEFMEEAISAEKYCRLLIFD